MKILVTIGLVILAINALVVVVAAVVLMVDWIRYRRTGRPSEANGDSGREPSLRV